MNNIIVHDVTKIIDMKFEMIEYDNYFVKKYYPVNKHSDIPLHKFWLIAEKCKVVNVFGNQYVNNGEVTVVFANKSKYLNDKLDIENKIRLYFKKKLHTDSEFVTTYKFLYDKSTVFFNSNDEEEKYNICIGNEFDLVVELNYIEMCAKHINFIWKIVQMKKIKMIDLKISLFTKHVQQPLQYEPLSQFKSSFVPSITDLQSIKNSEKQTQHVVESIPVQSKPIQSKPIAFTFTPGLLQNALSKLKTPKVVLDEELDQSNAFTPGLLQNALLKLKKPKVISEDEFVHIPIENEQVVTQLSNLKHVETRETRVIDIFRREYIDKMKTDHNLLKQISLNMDIIFEITNNNILTGLQLLKKMDRLKQYGRISDYS